MAVVNSDFEKITKELAKITAKNISQIEKMYAEMLAQQHLENEPLYDYRKKKFVPFKDNKELQALARAYAKSTAGTMVNLSKTKMLCVLDKDGKVVGLQKHYTDILDKAVMQTASGALDFHSAMRDSIIALGTSGLRVDYGGGITRRLDTVVRQNLLWGVKQASNEYNEMIGEELNCDGIEIDYHSNPRPSHEFMQGKQYILGKSRTINGKFYENADEALERLKDYGCLHYKVPIICGVSEPRYDDEELKKLKERDKRLFEIDGKEVTGYEAKQKMRRLETAVREQKIIKNTAKASGDNALVKRCNENIKAYKQKYSEISNITGIAEEPKRMSVPRAGINPPILGGAKVKEIVPPKEINLSKIQKTMTEDEAKEFEAFVRSTPEIESLYSKYSDGVSSVIRNSNGGEFSPVSKAVEYSFNKGKNVSKYSTLSHEMGHAFDELAKTDLKVSYNEVDLINERCKIGSGSTKLIRRVPSSSDDFLSAMRKDAELFKEVLKDAEAVRQIRLNDASVGVQDFADGFFDTRGKYIFSWGHGNAYYNRKYNRRVLAFDLEKELKKALLELGRDASSQAKVKKIVREYETASELWANAVSAITVGGQELEYMRKYCPNSIDAILKIIGGA
jgi:flavodoxin